MTDKSPGSGGVGEVVYCVVPRDLASTLCDALRDFYSDDPTVEVVVERRRAERRQGERRRANGDGRRGQERRKVGSEAGRRIEDRRAVVPSAVPPPLPRKARRFADRIAFVQRVEPWGRQGMDVEVKRLVARHQAGDESAMGELYLRYFSDVYGYAKIALRDHDEAEDAAQQVFEGVLRSLERYRVDEGPPFEAWLFTIARNVVSKAARRRWQGIEHASDIDVDETPSRDYEGGRGRCSVGPATEELLEATLPRLKDDELALFVRKLPEPQREVIVLRYVQDLSLTQIADVIDKTPNAVNKLHARALETLEGRLAAIGHPAARARGKRAPMLVRIRPARVIVSRRFALGSPR